MPKVLSMLSSFLRDEEGATLAEYLVLMGVITVAVIGGIAFFGNALATAFGEWGSWIRDNTGPP